MHVSFQVRGERVFFTGEDDVDGIGAAETVFERIFADDLFSGVGGGSGGKFGIRLIGGDLSCGRHLRFSCSFQK